MADIKQPITIKKKTLTLKAPSAEHSPVAAPEPVAAAPVAEPVQEAAAVPGQTSTSYVVPAVCAILCCIAFGVVILFQVKTNSAYGLICSGVPVASSSSHSASAAVPAANTETKTEAKETIAPPPADAGAPSTAAPAAATPEPATATAPAAATEPAVVAPPAAEAAPAAKAADAPAGI